MTSIETAVEHGLDRFDTTRTVEVPLRDALYTYKAIGELIAFFHQPDRYPDLEAVVRFLGDRDAGALHVLWEIYYERLRDVWPPDVQQAFDDGLLEANGP